MKRIGLEAGHCRSGCMRGSRFEAVLLETQHVKAALSAMTVKTDRKDARGFAQLIRMGSFRRCMPNRSRPIRGYFESSTQFRGFNSIGLFDDKLVGIGRRFKNMRGNVAARQSVAELEAHECARGIARGMIVTGPLYVGGHGKPFVRHVRGDV